MKFPKYPWFFRKEKKKKGKKIVGTHDQIRRSQKPHFCFCFFFLVNKINFEFLNKGKVGILYKF
jgi:hypothetical protein